MSEGDCAYRKVEELEREIDALKKKREQLVASIYLLISAMEIATDALKLIHKLLKEEVG